MPEDDWSCNDSLGSNQSLESQGEEFCCVEHYFTYALVLMGPLLHSSLMVTSAWLVAKLRRLLKNYAVVKTSLIACSVCSGLVGFTGLAQDAHLAAILIKNHTTDYPTDQPTPLTISIPFIACALLLQIQDNAFRLGCLALTALALDRVYCASKLQRDLRQLQTASHQGSVYQNSQEPDTGTEWVVHKLKAFRGWIWSGLVSLLDASRVCFTNRCVIAVATSLVSLLVYFCSDAGQYGTYASTVRLFDRILLICASGIGLFATMGARRLCLTQLNNFQRSQYHITLGVRVKLRQTITIAKLVFPSLLVILSWQLFCFAVEIILFVIHNYPKWNPEKPLWRQEKLVLHSWSLAIKVPPLIFFTVASLIRLRLEEKLSPVHPLPGGLPNPIVSQDVAPRTHITHVPETTVPPSMAPTAQPPPTPSTKSSLPRVFWPAKTKTRMLRRSAKPGPVPLDNEPKPLDARLKSVHHPTPSPSTPISPNPNQAGPSGRRDSQVPNLPPINLRRQSEAPTEVSQPAESMAWSISQFYQATGGESTTNSSGEQSLSRAPAAQGTSSSSDAPQLNRLLSISNGDSPENLRTTVPPGME